MLPDPAERQELPANPIDPQELHDLADLSDLPDLPDLPDPPSRQGFQIPEEKPDRVHESGLPGSEEPLYSDQGAPLSEPDKLFGESLPPLLNQAENAPPFGPYARFPQRLFGESGEGAGGREPPKGAGPDNRGMPYAPLPGKPIALHKAAYGGRMNLVLLLAGILIFAIILLSWAGNERRLQAQGEWQALPQIVTDTPYRIPPETLSRSGNLYTDKQVYDQLDGTKRDPAATLGAPSRESLPPPKPASPELASPEPTAPKPEDNPRQPANRAVAAVAGNAPTGPVFSESPPLSVQKTPVTKRPAARTGQAPGSKATGLFDPQGRYMVQLSSSRSYEDAQWEWSRISRANTELFAGAPRSIQKADLGEKGLYYRLRVGPFADQAGARDFCIRYRQRGGKCWWLSVQ